MSKGSVVNVRKSPVSGVSGATGGLVITADSFTIDTEERLELRDITNRVAEVVAASGVREGVASVWSLHTTCALFINEAQGALHADIKRALETIVTSDGGYLHNDPDHSDCDRSNADAHLRAMLLGHSATLQVTGGELVLGQWQRVLMAELDGPRARSFRIQVMGIG